MKVPFHAPSNISDVGTCNCLMLNGMTLKKKTVLMVAKYMTLSYLNLLHKYGCHVTITDIFLTKIKTMYIIIMAIHALKTTGFASICMQILGQ